MKSMILMKQITEQIKEKLIGQSLEKLDTWRDESYEKLINSMKRNVKNFEQNYI